jgi:hypothetical protein
MTWCSALLDFLVLDFKECGKMSSNARRQRLPARYWFLFNTWFSLLVICVSALATLHISINRAGWPVLIFCCGLVLLLAIRLHCKVRAKVSRWSGALSSVVILGAVVVVLWGSLIKGEFVSVYPDSWAYTAFATYLQNQVPAIGAGLQPILSFGRNLMVARYGTAGLLALFAEISGTDPCRAANIYAFLILTQTGLGFTLLARTYGAGRILSLCAGLFGVSIGWASEILKVGNWDQVLFLSFVPFILLRVRFSTFQTSRIPGILALGLCLGAAVFAYPEGVAISSVIYLPSVIWRLLRGHNPRGKVGRLAAACAVALLVSGVYLPRFVSFLSGQVLAGSTLRPGKGTFGGLLSARWLPAVYGLGGQPPLTTFDKLELIVPVLFLGLTLLALGSWWKKKDGILLTVPSFLLLSLWQAVLLRYDYGFYKILTMYWPVMVAAIFVGTTQLHAQLWSFARPLVAVAFCGLMAGAFFDELMHFQYSPWRQERRIEPFLELSNLKRITGDTQIYVVTQSWFNQMWAAFFLQGYDLVIPHPLGYLQHDSSGLREVTSEQAKVAFLLSDKTKSGAVWHNDIFSLQNHLDPVELLAIVAPNGVETVQGASFVWLNNQSASFTIHSDADRQALLIISECWPGPSRPGDEHRTLIVEVNGERLELEASSNLKVPLKLNQGINIARLSCKETATIDNLSSGDTRTLLLGIKGLKLATHEDPVEILAIHAPNQVETVEGDSFVWLNNQFTSLTIHSDAGRQAFLNINECWPGPSRPEDKRRTLIVEVNGVRAEFAASSNLKVPLKLDPGDNLIRLSCKETPTVDKLSSGDARTLLLGIKGFSVSTHEEPVEVSAIEAPNRVETVQGDSFIWLNNQFADLTIHSDAARQAFLLVRECWPGPSRPEDKKRTLLIEVNGTQAEIIASPNLKVPMTLNQGTNIVRLSCKETPTVDKLSSGDTRTLLLGIKGFSVTAAER